MEIAAIVGNQKMSVMFSRGFIISLESCLQNSLVLLHICLKCHADDQGGCSPLPEAILKFSQRRGN